MTKFHHDRPRRVNIAGAVILASVFLSGAPPAHAAVDCAVSFGTINGDAGNDTLKATPTPIP